MITLLKLFKLSNKKQKHETARVKLDLIKIHKVQLTTTIIEKEIQSMQCQALLINF